MKNLLLSLALIISANASTEVKKLYLDCKFDRGLYVPESLPMQRQDDVSIVINEWEDRESLLIEYGAIKTSVSKESPVLVWSQGVDTVKGEWRMFLDRVSGTFKTAFYAKVAEEADVSIKILKEADGMVNLRSVYYNCTKVTPLF
jgi:hypothetical protein